MDIQISYEHDREALEQLSIKDLARFVLLHEKKPQYCEVSISFVNDQVIASLNEQYRQISKPTDVLSFECDGNDDEMNHDHKNEDSLVLGDVIIAPDVARRQMQEYGTSFEEEINLLLVHGLLHLCGYDHMEEEDAQHMETLEAEILRAWSLR